MYQFGNLKNYKYISSLLAIIFLSINSFAAKGNLDRTFGDWGKAISYVNGAEKAFDAAVQTDGKIVVVGGVAVNSATWDFLVQRYNPDGTLDVNFGNAGKSALVISPRSEVANAVLIQRDGKIVVAGYIQQPDNYGDYCIVRLLPNGQLDQTFGESGVKILSITQTTDIPVSLAMQTLSGVDRIIVGGYVGTANTQFSVSRLNLNGQLDTTFGDGGTKSVSFGISNDILY
ncbi:MAG TPA: delta-60 repeat domain-containing protein, partial [Pyrinomonadaceae bacterium]|nr:delta-60 repeat domain-containing protein [Pyrinomonadaceae bacterium]